MTGAARAGGQLRVVIVTDQYAPMVGGVPAATSQLAHGLARRGHAVLLVAPSAGGDGNGDACSVDGEVEADPAGTPGGDRHQAEPGGSLAVSRHGSVRWPWYEGQRLGFLSPPAARTLIGDFAPDVVHVHSPLTLGVLARLAARRRVPVIYTNHYLPANAWPATPRAAASAGAAGAAVRWGAGAARALGVARGQLAEAGFYAFVNGFANRCDHVTAPSATALRLLRTHGLRSPSQVVSNGVDLDRFTPATGLAGPPARDGGRLRAKYGLPAGRQLILYVGRLSQEKRADLLVEAAALLTDPDPVLVLAGTGPDEGRLRALVAARGVAERVAFAGHVADVDLPGLYRQAGVFAIASPAELQSLATMEAMASGLPVVAVAAGALGELVHAGENGFLTSPGRPADIAVCLDLLCRQEDLRGRMSKASLRIIADHDGRRVLTRWESIYRAMAHSKSGRR